MFDKIKQLNELKKIQSEITKEKFEAEKEGVKVIINGDLSIEEIILNPELDLSRQALLVKECSNEAFKQAQISVAKKMSGMNLVF
jgi:DNA-binding protein YbaB